MGVAVVAGELERVGRLGAVVADATDERRVVEGERNPDDATVMISVTDDRTDDDERRWRRRAALLRRRELLSPVEVVDAVSSARHAVRMLRASTSTTRRRRSPGHPDCWTAPLRCATQCPDSRWTVSRAAHARRQQRCSPLRLLLLMRPHRHRPRRNHGGACPQEQ